MRTIWLMIAGWGLAIAFGFIYLLSYGWYKVEHEHELSAGYLRHTVRVWHNGDIVYSEYLRQADLDRVDSADVEIDKRVKGAIGWLKKYNKKNP